MIKIFSLINADYTAIAVLIALGAVLGKTTLTQLIVLAFIGVVAQVLNEFINISLIQVCFRPIIIIPAKINLINFINYRKAPHRNLY